MAFHILLKRCDDCGRVNAWRKPNSESRLVRILPLLQCPYCHPGSLEQCCASCRLPFEAIPNSHGNTTAHANGLCNTCIVRMWRESNALQMAAVA